MSEPLQQHDVPRSFDLETKQTCKTLAPPDTLPIEVTHQLYPVRIHRLLHTYGQVREQLWNPMLVKLPLLHVQYTIKQHRVQGSCRNLCLPVPVMFQV